MKPKLWNGPSAVGEARDRFNKEIDTPYQTASGPGFRADKKDQFSEVFVEDEKTKEELGLYILVGQSSNGIRCATARGLVRGRFATKSEHEGADWFLAAGRGSPYLVYYGGGVAAHLHAFGADLSKEAHIETTRNGISFAQKHDARIPLQGLLTIAASVLTGIKTDGGWTFGYSTCYVQDGVFYPKYIYRIGTAWHESLPPLPLPPFNATPTAPRIVRISGTELLALSCSADAGYSGYKVRFSKSTNNGQTWQALDGITWLDGYVDLPGATAMELLEIVASMTSIPRKDAQPLVYFRWLNPSTGEYEHRIYEYSSDAMTPHATLFVSSLQWGMVTPTSSLGDPVTLQFVLGGSPTTKHVTFTYAEGIWSGAMLPWESYNTGRISFVEKDFVACPVYDADDGYVIYGWSPGGTPKKVAKIKTDLPAPDTDLHSGLWNFNTILKLQNKDGRSANGHPGMQWIG